MRSSTVFVAFALLAVACAFPVEEAKQPELQDAEPLAVVDEKQPESDDEKQPLDAEKEKPAEEEKKPEDELVADAKSADEEELKSKEGENLPQGPEEEKVAEVEEKVPELDDDDEEGQRRGGGGSQDYFQLHDKDLDGFLDQHEFRYSYMFPDKALRKAFIAADADGNSKLDRDEFGKVKFEGNPFDDDDEEPLKLKSKEQAKEVAEEKKEEVIEEKKEEVFEEKKEEVVEKAETAPFAPEPAPAQLDSFGGEGEAPVAESSEDQKEGLEGRSDEQIQVGLPDAKQESDQEPGKPEAEVDEQQEPEEEKQEEPEQQPQQLDVAIQEARPEQPKDEEKEVIEVDSGKLEEPVPEQSDSSEQPADVVDVPQPDAEEPPTVREDLDVLPPQVEDIPQPQEVETVPEEQPLASEGQEPVIAERERPQPIIVVEESSLFPRQEHVEPADEVVVVPEVLSPVIIEVPEEGAPQTVVYGEPQPQEVPQQVDVEGARGQQEE